MANAIVSIQIIPRTPNGESVIPYVDRAIEIIKAAGVPYRVAPLETTMEGDFNLLLGVVQDMNTAMAEMGCPSIISQIKVYYVPAGTASMDVLLEKYPDGQ